MKDICEASGLLYENKSRRHQSAQYMKSDMCSHIPLNSTVAKGA